MIRSQPIFYGYFKSTLFITDSTEYFQKVNGLFELDNNKIEEYISSGNVYGNATIYKNVFAIQAGELVCLANEEFNSYRHFEFIPQKDSLNFESIIEFSQTFDKILIEVFSRMVKNNPSVNNWVIPLSGGHDSRLIVNMLYRLGVKNVICFTYGLKNNEQSSISKRISEAAGFEWHFVEYTEEKWRRLHDMGLIDKFTWYTFNGVSTPHFQDFLAVYELKEKGVIQSGDLFLPGHTNDFLTGCNLSQTDLNLTTKEKAVERAYMMHSIIRDKDYLPVRTIEAIYDSIDVDPKNFQEYINWQELRAKFTVNSLRTYEFFGYDTRLPYWDRQIIEFWLKVPSDLRSGRKVFKEAEKHGILVDEILAIPFFGKSDRGDSKHEIEDLLRKILPNRLKTFILRVSGRKVKYNAGLNQIFELKAKTVRGLLSPVSDFPESSIKYFNNFLNRHTYQVDYHYLSSFYTIRKQLDRTKGKN